MATYLSSEALRRAIDHIVRYGDTDVFPHFAETAFLIECRDDVVEELQQLDLDNFQPIQAAETIAPKSRLGFRTVHQLPMLETVLFTAAVIEIAEDLEKIKRPRDEFGPFAYRFVPGSEPSLFLEGRNYSDWLKWQQERLTTEPSAFVVSSDISDFYQQIYFHRLENVLDVATSKKGVAAFIKKLIKQVRSKQSHGIPIGGTASRLLAEAVIADTDSALADEGYVFTRYVDDYRLFLSPEQPAYEALVFLAEQLATGEGLCLNVKKTRIQSADEFRAHLEEHLIDPDAEAEQSAIEFLSHTIYFEEIPSQEDIDRLRAMNLVNMLEEEIAREDWDFGRIKSILLGLRLTSDENAVDAVAIHLNLLLPFMKEIVLLVDQIRREGKSISGRLEDKVKELLNSSVVDRLPLLKLWLLEFFVRGCLHISSAELNKVRFDDPITLRQSLLIRGLNGDVNYFRRQKTRFDQWNKFEQPYVLLGATCLPRDEFQTWVSAIRTSMDRALDRLFCSWVREKNGELEAIISRRPARP